MERRTLALSDVSNGDGAWSVLGPAGTWPAEVTADGFLPESVDVTIVADGTLEGQDVFIHVDVPHGTLRPRTLRFTLLRGHQDDQVLRLGNVEGHQDLTFSVGEVVIPPPDEGGGKRNRPRRCRSRRVPTPMPRRRGARATRPRVTPVPPPKATCSRNGTPR